MAVNHEDLARLGLQPVTAYVPKSQDAANQKKRKNAERQARHREKIKQAGVRQMLVPHAVADAVIQAGGWEPWLATDPSMVLDEAQRRAAELGYRLQSRAGWRGALARWLIGA